MRSQRDLIVPIRDRRQRRRIVTLKNFRNVSIAALLIFMAITIYSETRGPRAGDYGRLYSSEMPAREVAKQGVEVVQEAATAPAVADESHADPTLVEPMARAQWLAANASEPRSQQPVSATIVPPPTTRGGDVTIVGGPEGVTVVRGERKRAVLKGGFGR